MRNFFKSAAIIMAGMFGFTQTASSNAIKANTEIKATSVRKASRERLPFVSPMPKSPFKGYGWGNPGLSPKEYGLTFGNGGSKKSNKNRYSHNAKLKRRMAK